MKESNSRILLTIFLFLIVILLCPIIYGKIIYVEDDASGLNDGTSWENAYVYLQDALADANIADKPAEIWVAQGVYKPDQGINQTLGDREATFKLINGISLIGGYAGFGEADPNAHDFKLYETFLSGDLNGDDVVGDEPPVDWEQTKRENSYHVIDASFTNEMILLDGFVISGGSAGDWSAESGGGMVIWFGNVTIANCTFINCSGLYGGAMYIDNGNVTITNCKFSDNFAYAGAGVYNVESDLKITGCFFQRNVQTTEPWQFWISIYWAPGGGGMLNSYSNPTLVDCVFIDNTAEHGGGISNHSSNPVLVNCTLTGNLASCYMQHSLSFGGGMRNKNSSPILTSCTLRENKAIYSGGGMDNSWDSNPILTDCVFSGNFAGDYGGGIDNNEGRLTLTNCIFSGNMAGHSGGSIRDANSVSTLTNCTFDKNKAPNGSALACDSYKQKEPSNVKLSNCIVSEGVNSIWNNDGSIITISYSNIQGGWEGEGNIDVDPLFVEPGYWVHIENANVVVEPNDPNAVWVDGDYHLKSEYGRWDSVSGSWVVDDVTSPCIDAGDPNSPVGDEPEPNGVRVNMGAYGGTVEASKSQGKSHK